jgi:hypothetical protein
VPLGNVPALAATLVELLQDDEARVRMAKEARQLAGDEHSWRTRATALEAFLSETVPAPRSGRRGVVTGGRPGADDHLAK